MDANELKKKAAEKAVEQIQSGMIIGLGTGSTTYFALVKIGELQKEGKLTDIKGIPSSHHTEQLANELKIPLTNFLEHPVIDITIDGADEVDPELNLIKGGGGALLREKIIAQSSKKEIIIVDESKLVKKLGEKWHVPIEVIPFAVGTEINYLKSIGADKIDIRKTEKNELFLTDENNVILDANFGVIENPSELARKLEQRAGIVEHGLFIGLASEVIVASRNGIQILKK